MDGPKGLQMSPGIKSQTILTILCVKGSKVSLRESWGGVLTRFCINFPWKRTSFDSLWGNICPSRGHRKANKWDLVSNLKQFPLFNMQKAQKQVCGIIKVTSGQSCKNFVGKWWSFESLWSNISPPRGHRKAIVWPLVSKTRRFLAIACLKCPKPDMQAL